MSDYLDFEQSPIPVRVGESLIYTFSTTDYGGTPTVDSVTATNLTTGKTVTAQVLNGSSSVSSDDVTLPAIEPKTRYSLYGIDVTFTCGSNTFKRTLKVKCIA